MRVHPPVLEIETMLPPPGSTKRASFAHVLLCRECRMRALDLLEVPRPPSAIEEVEEEIGRLSALFKFLLDLERPE